MAINYNTKAQVILDGASSTTTSGIVRYYDAHSGDGFTTGLWQLYISDDATVEIQGRLKDNMPWQRILQVDNTNTQHFREIVALPEMRAVATITAGTVSVAAFF